MNTIVTYGNAEIKSDYCYQWDIYLTPGFLHRKDNTSHKVAVHASGESLSMVICQIALKAVKWLKDNGTKMVEIKEENNNE